MKAPVNPDHLAEYTRYRAALVDYRSARKTFMAARKELRTSRIAVKRLKRSERNQASQKIVEIQDPHP